MSTYRTFWKNTGKVATRSVFAQAATIAVLPVLAVLYSPHDFGVLALFTSYTAVIGALVNARFDLAINLPKEDADAWNILRLCFLISLVVAGGLGFWICLAHPLFNAMSPVFALLQRMLIDLQVPLIYVDSGLQLLESLTLLGEDLGLLKYLIPAQVFMIGGAAIITQWLTRKQSFGVYAILGIGQVMTQIVLQMVLGMLSFGGIGLVIAQVAGFVFNFSVSLIYMLRFCRPASQHPIRLSMLMQTAWQYKNNPIYLMPGHFLNSYANQFPVLFMTDVFGLTVTGYYAMASKLVLMPASLIGSSLYQVFYPEAARQFAEHRQCRHLFNRMIRILTMITLPMSMAMAIGGYWLVGLVFDSSWHATGVAIAILAIGNMIRFIDSPVSGLWVISGNQRFDLIWQLAMFVLVAGGLAAGTIVFGDWTWALIGYGVGLWLAFGINLLCCWLFACGYVIAGRRVRPSGESA